jgi:hypothetical protein
MLFSIGSRATTTFRKLPMLQPRVKTKIIQKIVSGARSIGRIRSLRSEAYMNTKETNTKNASQKLTIAPITETRSNITAATIRFVARVERYRELHTKKAIDKVDDVRKRRTSEAEK